MANDIIVNSFVALKLKYLLICKELFLNNFVTPKL